MAAGRHYEVASGGMIHDYVPIVVFFVIALGFGAAQLILSRLLGPQKPTTAKMLPYECGIVPTGDARKRFSVQFYVVAMLFILFDIEAVFLWPWAAVYLQLLAINKAFALIEMGVFLGILIVGFVYLYKRKAFEWE